MKNWRSIFLSLVISIAALALALRGNDISRLAPEFVHGRYLFVIPACLLILVGVLARTVRWRLLLGKKITLYNSYHILNVGNFLNAVAPMRLGEVARGFLVTRLDPPIPFLTAISSILIERLTDLLAVAGLVIAVLTLSSVTPEIEQAAKATGLLALIGVIVLSILAVNRKAVDAIVSFMLRLLPLLERLNIRQVVHRVLDGVAPLGSSVTAMLGVMVMTALAWTSVAIGFFVLLFVFYDAPSIETGLMVLVTITVAVALPAVPGSVGPFEVAVMFGLTLTGLIDQAPQERAFAYAILLHVVTAVLSSFIGMIGLLQQNITLRELIEGARQATARQSAVQTTGSESMHSANQPTV